MYLSTGYSLSISPSTWFTLLNGVFSRLYDLGYPGAKPDCFAHTRVGTWELPEYLSTPQTHPERLCSLLRTSSSVAPPSTPNFLMRAPWHHQVRDWTCCSGQINAFEDAPTRQPLFRDKLLGIRVARQAAIIRICIQTLPNYASIHHKITHPYSNRILLCASKVKTNECLELV